MGCCITFPSHKYYNNLCAMKLKMKLKMPLCFICTVRKFKIGKIITQVDGLFLDFRFRFWFLSACTKRADPWKCSETKNCARSPSWGTNPTPFLPKKSSAENSAGGCFLWACAPPSDRFPAHNWPILERWIEYTACLKTSCTIVRPRNVAVEVKVRA